MVTALLLALPLALLPAPALASGPKLPWGAEVSRIRKQHPGGKTISVADGEVEYRVVEAAYGQKKALATYSFVRPYGLHRVFVDFPEPHAHVSLSRDRPPPRPTFHEALAMRRSLVRVLSRIWGPPQYVDEDGIAGGISWGLKGGDWVMLDFWPIADGRVRVLLTARRKDDKSDDTPTEKSLGTDFSRTKPASWSESGAFGVRFGMGPGDVQQKYRKLSELWNPASKPVQTYFASSYVKGDVELSFDFFRGRLVSFTVARNTEHPKAQYGSLELYWTDCDAWLGHVLAILKTKYGTPVKAPTDIDLKKAAKMGAGTRPLLWAWRKGDMAIQLSGAVRGMPFVKYLELSAWTRAEAAEAAHIRKQEQRVRAKF